MGFYPQDRRVLQDGIETTRPTARPDRDTPANWGSNNTEASLSTDRRNQFIDSIISKRRKKP